MDVDIDFPTDFDPLDYFETAIRASMVKDGQLKKHPAGVYFQNIAKDKLTELAAIPYEEAEELGFFKIDFLHLGLLDHFESKGEIRALIKIEPDWFLLRSADVVQRLFQIHRHFDIVSKVNPQSVQELADCIALIRPSKKFLLSKYTEAKTEEDKVNIRKILYAKPADGRMWFKKAHSVAYALTIVLQLHLIKGGIM